MLSMPCSRHSAANLRIEHQVSTSIRLTCSLEEEVEKLRTRLDELAARSGDDALNERVRLSYGGGRIEHAPMGHHPHEFNDTEHRESPSLRSLGQSDEPRRRRAMQLGLAAMCVDENVGVNGNHGRSIMS